MIYRTRVWRWEGANRFHVRYIKAREPVELEFNGFLVRATEDPTTGGLIINVEPHMHRADDLVLWHGTADGLQSTIEYRVTMRNKHAASKG